MLEGGKKLFVCLQVLKWISCFVNKLKIPHHFNLITTNLSLKSITMKRFRCSDGSNFAYLGVAKEDVQIVNFIGLFVLQVHSTARKVHQVFQNQMMKTIPTHRGLYQAIANLLLNRRNKEVKKSSGNGYMIPYRFIYLSENLKTIG